MWGEEAAWGRQCAAMTEHLVDQVLWFTQQLGNSKLELTEILQHFALSLLDLLEDLKNTRPVSIQTCQVTNGWQGVSRTVKQPLGYTCMLHDMCTSYFPVNLLYCKHCKLWHEGNCVVYVSNAASVDGDSPPKPQSLSRRYVWWMVRPKYWWFLL